MISTKYKGYELVGKKAKPVRDIANGAGQGISKGSIVTIVDAHYNLTIQADKCPCCGQFTRISGVKRHDLEIIEEN